MNVLKYFLIVALSGLILNGCADEPKNNDDIDHQNENQGSDPLKDHLEDYEEPLLKWGYMNKVPALIIEAQFDDAREFKEGLAAVKQNGLWGYIQPSGEFVVEPQFLEGYSFHDGLARVKSYNGLYGFIDQQGQYVLSPIYDHIDDFSHGRARLDAASGWCFLDPKGDTLNFHGAARASHFTNGVAKVKLEGNWILVQSDGSHFYDHPMSQVQLLDGGISYKLVNESKYGVMDFQGNVVIQPMFDLVESVLDEYVVAMKNQEWVIYDHSGNMLFKSPDDIIGLGSGRFGLYRDGEWSLIKADGTEVLQGLKEIHRFSEGWAEVMKGDAWSFVNEEGNYISENKFLLTWKFQNGLARVIHEGGVGFIDHNGNIVIPAKFYEVRDFDESGLARVQLMP